MISFTFHTLNNISQDYVGVLTFVYVIMSILLCLSVVEFIYCLYYRRINHYSTGCLWNCESVHTGTCSQVLHGSVHTGKIALRFDTDSCIHTRMVRIGDNIGIQVQNHSYQSQRWFSHDYHAVSHVPRCVSWWYMYVRTYVGQGRVTLCFRN